MNRVNIPAWAIDLGKSRRGLCALTAESTALIVVDLPNAFLAPGEDGARERTVSERH